MTFFKYPSKGFWWRLRARRWWNDRVYRLRCDLRRLLGRCERCSVSPAQLTPSCTAYAWDGKGRDPNAPIMLCADCAEEHIAYWDSVWSDYYGGLI